MHKHFFVSLNTILHLPFLFPTQHNDSILPFSFGLVPFLKLTFTPVVLNALSQLSASGWAFLSSSGLSQGCWRFCPGLWMNSFSDTPDPGSAAALQGFLNYTVNFNLCLLPVLTLKFSISFNVAIKTLSPQKGTLPPGSSSPTKAQGRSQKWPWLVKSPLVCTAAGLSTHHPHP